MLTLLKESGSAVTRPVRPPVDRTPTFPSVLAAIDSAASLDELLGLRTGAHRRFRGGDRQATIDTRVAERVLQLLTTDDA
jgi:hypothetical protein